MQGGAMDRASQAELKYREALEEALRAGREHGEASPQAVAAWDVVDEIEVCTYRTTRKPFAGNNQRFRMGPARVVWGVFIVLRILFFFFAYLCGTCERSEVAGGD